MEHHFAVPNDPGILGAQAFLQAYSVQPGSTSSWIVASNGLQLTIGDQ